MKHVGRSTSDSIRMPAVGEGGDDGADAVVPLDGVVVLEGGVGIGVVEPGSSGSSSHTHGPSWKYEYFTVRSVSLEAPVGDRVELDEVQPPAGTEQLVHDARPRVDVRAASRARRCPV